MMSLFSSFDSFYFFASMGSILCMVSFSTNFCFKFNVVILSMKSLYMFLENFFHSMKPKSFNKIFSYFCILGALNFLLFNLMGVWPFNFAFTSQLSLIMFTSFLFWFSFFSFSLSQNLKGFMSHLVPEGAPVYLIWFLYLIEIISNLIRPLTLTIRLMANILAGHLLMILLFGLVFNQVIFFPFYILLNSVELFVSMIQSYIFFTMVCLYYSES